MFRLIQIVSENSMVYAGFTLKRGFLVFADEDGKLCFSSGWNQKHPSGEVEFFIYRRNPSGGWEGRWESEWEAGDFSIPELEEDEYLVQWNEAVLSKDGIWEEVSTTHNFDRTVAQSPLSAEKAVVSERAAMYEGVIRENGKEVYYRDEHGVLHCLSNFVASAAT